MNLQMSKHYKNLEIAIKNESNSRGKIPWRRLTEIRLILETP